ncbi:MAG: hypothetical protein M3Y87_16110 [Myxococcota bacterium]|nr:hypothetical protein [Myxococcota bacterium]
MTGCLLALPTLPVSAQATPRCARATELWRDGFETGDHRRWTGESYFEDWGDGCQSTSITTARRHSGRYAQRSEITCASSSPEGVHRGYGDLQFAGPRVMSEFTNAGTGLDAPHGIVTTFWTYTGDMHYWQNGQSIAHVEGIHRRTTAMCQWHWGLYASGDNTDVELYEDDKIVWRLDAPLEENWAREPLLGQTLPVCRAPARRR